MRVREGWVAVVQEEDGAEETEVVTLEGLSGSPGATVETTDGRRITLLEPAGERQAAA